MNPIQPTLSACIVLYNSGAQAAQAVRCFQESDMEVQLFVVDNSPGEATMARLRWQCPGLQYIAQKRNIGYGRANNVVLPRLSSTYHLICNPDVTFQPQLLRQMVQYMEMNPDCAILTPRVLSPDGSEQFLPRRAPTIRYLLGGRLEKLPGPFRKWRSEYTLRDETIEVPTCVYFATGCFMLIRTSVFRSLNGFDSKFFLYHEDSDLSQRALRCGNIVYHPQFVVTHEWNSRSNRDPKRLWHHLVSTVRYLNKWGWEW